jgi:hypothetical protein
VNKIKPFIYSSGAASQYLAFGEVLASIQHRPQAQT